MELLQNGSDYYACEFREGEVRDRMDTRRDIIDQTRKLTKEWEQAKKLGEHDYLFNQLRDRDVFEKGALDTVTTDASRAVPLRIVLLKYPRDLLKFYLRVRYEAESQQLGEAILMTKLPKREKLAAFRKMTRGPKAVREVARVLLRKLRSGQSEP